jgi:DNA-binding Lrp family transcriptional regulator
MPELDDTDIEILSLLADDGRRPYSDIADSVGLSAPAVSNRVTRLKEAGVINRFTVHVDQSTLRAGVPVFVRLDPGPAELDSLRSRLADTDGVEHLFVTAESELWFYGRAETGNVRGWVEGLLEDPSEATYSVTLVDDTEWTPSVDGTAFALTCAECGNTVDSEGESVRIEGSIYHFCCPSCHSRFEERYQRIESDA